MEGNIQRLPIKGDLGYPYRLTIIVAFFMVVASAISLLFPRSVYPTDEQRLTFLTNDVVNLLVGLPLLLITLRLVKQEKWIGLIIWPGSLFYVMYNYLAYLFGMPLSWATSVNGFLVLLSLYAIFVIISRVEFSLLEEKLEGVGPRVIASVLIIIFGAGFFIRAAIEISSQISGSGGLKLEEFGVLVADMAGSVFWLISGFLLLLRKPKGYLLGWSGMFAVVALNIGLLVYLLLQPILTHGAINFVDLIFITVFTIVCALPFYLFLKPFFKSN